MDSSNFKRYNLHGYNSREHLEHYYSDKKDMVFSKDTLEFPIENLTRTFKMGKIKGDILADLSTGSFVHHLYVACEFFKNIIVLKVSDRCIMELKRYLDSRTGAFEWGHVIQLHKNIGGDSDQFQDKEGQLRTKIPQVVKCDMEKEENITDPIVLPLVDCIISAWLLDTICKDEDEYIRHLKKFSRMLKPGGNLILIGALGTTYLTVGKEKFHAFTYDEEFVRKALARVGFVIDDFKARKRTGVSDLIDYKVTIFIVAHKEK